MILQEFQILWVNGVAMETGPLRLVSWSRFGLLPFKKSWFAF